MGEPYEMPYLLRFRKFAPSLHVIKRLILTFLLSITLHIFHAICFLFAGLISILVATLTISTTYYNHSNICILPCFHK